MKIRIYNDTDKPLVVHAGSWAHGATPDQEKILPRTEGSFSIEPGKEPWIKIWDGMILVSQQ